MEKTNKLIKCADRLSYKYAETEDAELYKADIESSIWTALKNASEQNNPNVMMPFYQMAQQDKVDLNFDITRDDSWGRKNITVNNLTVIPNKNNAWEKYLPLQEQVKKYLDKNWELFMNKKNGAPVTYDNFTIHLAYKFKEAF